MVNLNRTSAVLIPLQDIEKRLRKLLFCSSFLTVMVLAALAVRIASPLPVAGADLAGLLLLGLGALLLSLGLIGSLRYTTSTLAPRIERAVYRDDATGLCTPHYFFNRLQAEISRSYRYSVGFSVLYVQVRGAKCLEENGRDHSCALAKNIASHIKTLLRQEDLSARWNTHSFVILLPHTQFLACYMVAERLESDLRECVAISNCIHARSVECTIGCATFPFDGNSPLELILFAQRAAARNNDITSDPPFNMRRPSFS